MMYITIKFGEDTGKLSIKKVKDQRQKESESDNGNESENRKEG